MGGSTHIKHRLKALTGENEKKRHENIKDETEGEKGIVEYPQKLSFSCSIYST